MRAHVRVSNPVRLWAGVCASAPVLAGLRVGISHEVETPPCSKTDTSPVFRSPSFHPLGDRTSIMGRRRRRRGPGPTREGGTQFSPRDRPELGRSQPDLGRDRQKSGWDRPSRCAPRLAASRERESLGASEGKTRLGPRKGGVEKMSPEFDGGSPKKSRQHRRHGARIRTNMSDSGTT